MTFEEFRFEQMEFLANVKTRKEMQETFQNMEMADCAEKSNIEKDIKSVELQKARAELIKVEAETEKVKAETATSKVEKFCKIGGLVLTGVGTIIGPAALIFINGMNIASHEREELKYSCDAENRERTIFNKTIDLFTRGK